MGPVIVPTRHYRLLEIPSKGAYGVVCIAKDTSDVVYAIKVLSLDNATKGKLIKRARDEARLLSRLDHPNLVRVEPTLEVNGRQAIVMEYVEGANADELLRSGGPLPTAIAMALIKDAARGLEAAWSTPVGSDSQPMHVIHRDLKPGNVMLSTDGVVKVVDFGVAKASFDGRESQSTAFVPGSRGYIAPERYDGDDTPKGDVYALGLTLIQLLSGHKPVASLRYDRHDGDIGRAIDHLVLPGADDIEGDLRALLRRMCAYEADDRPWMNQTAEELETLLQRVGGADLEAYAERVVRPILAARTRMPPHDHPRYPEVRFLEGPARDASGLNLNDEVKRLVGAEDFPDRAHELAALLAGRPEANVRPLLSVLDHAARPGWMFWRKQPSPAHTVAALTALAPIAGPEVRNRARKLSRHPDETIARAARDVLGATPG